MKLTAELKECIAAAEAGEVPGLRELLCEHPDLVNDPRPICGAALHGSTETVSLLLSAGADVNALTPSHEQYRPLHRAIEHRGVPKNSGHLATVRLLLGAGADVQQRATWMGLTPLAIAAMTGDEEMIRLLRESTESLDLFHAAILAEAEKVRRLLAKNPALATSRDVNAMTPLHYAALCGRTGAKIADAMTKLTRALLDAGADPNDAPKIGPYPSIAVLHLAAKNNLALARVLLEAGANPNLGFGATLWRDPTPMTELFLAHGADVNGREDSGQPLLHSRIHWNLPSVVYWLLEQGANPNATDAHGNTALHEAASRGINAEVVKALLKYGAKPATKNKAGQTGLGIAKEKKRKVIVEILEKGR